MICHGTSQNTSIHIYICKDLKLLGLKTTFVYLLFLSTMNNGWFLEDLRKHNFNKLAWLSVFWYVKNVKLTGKTKIFYGIVI